MESAHLADLHHEIRHVQGRGVAGDLLPDPHGQPPVEHRVRPEDHEQHETGLAAHPARALLDCQRLDHLGNLVQRAIDLRRPDPDGLDVDDAVRPAVDPGVPRVVELDQVAVRPDAGVLLEVGLMKARSIVPEESERP